MSAKEAYRRPVFHIEVLPDELLTEILRHATWVPYAVDASDLVVKRLQSTQVSTIAREFKLSLVTKRYLILVCKKWYWLAFRFLYEWIQAVKAKNLPGLVHAIERTSNNALENCTAVGWYTKRFDIDFRRTGTETAEQFNNIGPLLLRLLRNVNNLEVLTIGRCFDHSWMDSSVHDWCPKLKYLNWIREEHDRASAEDWQHFLTCHPDIIGLNPCRTTVPNGCPIPFTHSLRTWVTGNCSPVPVLRTFTALERLSVNMESPYFPIRDLTEMLTGLPLPSLRILQVNFVAHSVSLQLNTTLPLFRFMPNVRRVELIFPLWPPKLGVFTLPGTVSVLGIRVCSVTPRRELVRTLLQGLKSVVVRACGPLTIQFLDDGTLNGILVHEQYIGRHAKEWKLLERFLDPQGCEYVLG